MFRLFRKTRQDLLKNHKLLRYLTYAAGEIFLVIIGILAALQINNWSEEKKNIKTSQKILRQIQSDIRANILETTTGTNYYFFKDSLLQITLRDEINYFDFQDPNVKVARSPLTTHFPLTLLDNGFQNWADQESVAEEFLELNEAFNKLFIDWQASLDYNAKKITSVVDENVNFLAENFTWFSARISGNISDTQMRKEAAYYQYDTLYKNRAAVYNIYAIDNYLPLIDAYRVLSMDTYRKIDELLGPDKTAKEQESFLLSDAHLEKLAGTYQDLEFPDSQPVITVGDNSIYYTLENIKIELTPLSSYVFFTAQLSDPAMIYFQVRGDSVYGMHESQYGLSTELRKLK